MVTLITGPRIGASGENVSPPTTGHQKGQKWSGVSVGIFFSPFFFWTRRLQVLQGISVKTSRKHSKISRACVNIKWTITQKLDPSLKPSNYKQLRKIHMFPAQMSKCPCRFWERRPRNFAHMFCQSRDLTTGLFFFRRIYLVVRSTYVYVHKCLEEECRT